MMLRPNCHREHCKNVIARSPARVFARCGATKQSRFWVVFTALTLAAAPLHAETTEPVRKPLRVGTAQASVEVADTLEQWQKGLSGRDRLGPDEGMLFIFQEPRMQFFWMKDTRVPLDIAFLDDEKRIFQVELMEPESSRTHASQKPCLYVLEMPGGWFARHGIHLGDQAEF